MALVVRLARFEPTYDPSGICMAYCFLRHLFAGISKGLWPAGLIRCPG